MALIEISTSDRLAKNKELIE